MTSITAIEGTTAFLTLSRGPSSALMNPLPVALRLAGGTAERGADFVLTDPVIPAGASSVAVPVQALNDSIFEHWEDALIQIVAGSSYRISQSFMIGPFLSVLDMGVDLDVDSDNNGGTHPGAPARSAAEDAVEDVSGDDSAPGKVILVNDGDSDGDGIVDFADGYDLDAATPADDGPLRTRFVPMILELGAGLESGAKVRLSYPASDPRTVSASSDDPYKLPEGRLRLWKWDGNSRRRVVDYLAPGEYLWSSISMSRFYAEAVRPSDTTGDIAVTIDLDPTGSAGFIYRDTVHFTTTRAEVLARNDGDAAFAPTNQLVRSDLSGSPDSNYGYAIGAFQTYKVRVFDPRRSGISQFFIDGQPLSLTQQGTFYETPEFVVVEAGEPVSWSVPYQRGVVSAPHVQFRYNPVWPFSSGAKVNAAQPHRAQLAKTIEEVVAEMEAQGWTGNRNDPGAFGKEVHRRVGQRLHGQNGWHTDVYVNRTTREIVAINQPPATLAGTTQVDIVRVKEGHTIDKHRRQHWATSEAGDKESHERRRHLGDDGDKEEVDTV
jgi:hypothetical protein